MCRWCGGEMMIDKFPFRTYYQWECVKCNASSKLFDTEAEALEWAQQPIPFLFDEKLFGPNAIIIKGINETITATLAVREEER
jgi:hypothetical protein